MFKQVYRFLSIALISNLLFSPAVFSKTETSTNAHIKPSIIERLFGHKKPATEQNQKPNIQKPNCNDHQYVTKYGVYFPDDIYNSYPQVQPENK